MVVLKNQFVEDPHTNFVLKTFVLSIQLD